MPEPDFKAVATRLLEGGISAQCARRAVNELRDHYDDLFDSAMACDKSRGVARQTALRRLGLEQFVVHMLSRRELKAWAFRYPRAALMIYPLACLAALPALPIMAGAAHASSIARWGASLLLAGIVTAIMLLGMQLSIVLG